MCSQWMCSAAHVSAVCDMVHQRKGEDFREDHPSQHSLCHACSSAAAAPVSQGWSARLAASPETPPCSGCLTRTGCHCSGLGYLGLCGELLRFSCIQEGKNQDVQKPDFSEVKHHALSRVREAGAAHGPRYPLHLHSPVVIVCSHLIRHIYPNLRCCVKMVLHLPCHPDRRSGWVGSRVMNDAMMCVDIQQ